MPEVRPGLVADDPGSRNKLLGGPSFASFASVGLVFASLLTAGGASDARSTTLDGNYKLQRGVCRREGDDLYIFQPGFAAGGEDVILGDLLLAFRVDDPQCCRAFQALR